MWWKRKKRPLRILSIDGGGIRGLIPATIIKELCNRMERKGLSLNFWEHFDIIAGTSTGALIAMVLATDLETVGSNNLAEFYRNRGPDIFPPSRFRSVRTLNQAFRTKYDGDHFETILEEIFGPTRLSDSQCQLLVPSFSMDHGVHHIFNSLDPNAMGNPRLVDLARAATAAPSFFPLKEMTAAKTGRIVGYADGGMVANSPAMIAYVEGRSRELERKQMIVSLGTGSVDLRHPYNESKNWGFLDWVNPFHSTPLINIMLEGQGPIIDSMLGSIGEIDYTRINPPLARGQEAIDDASRENLDALSEVAYRAIIAHHETLDRIVDQLSAEP